MAERTLYREFRRENETTRYPFAQGATLANAAGRLFVEGTFLDAVLYPVGGQAGLYLSEVRITHQQVTLYVGDAADPRRCSGAFALVNPGDNVPLADAAGRPAGLLVSEGRRLGIFQSWGVGTHAFTREQTEFCATVCVPTPEAGVRAVALETGEVLAGDVWLVGDDGVVLRTEDVEVPAACGAPAARLKVVRVDVVGDPLFRRRLCASQELFETPNFIRTVRVEGPGGAFECAPGAAGDFKMFANNALAADTVLRIVSTPDGVEMGAAGSPTAD